MRKARLSAREVALVAQRIERNGERFYSRAAAELQDESVGALCLRLAEQERFHHKTFAQLAERSSEVVPLDFPGEEELFVQALADESMFPGRRTGELLADDITAKGVLELALRMEHEAVRFYEGLWRLLPPADADLLAAIIEEERVHVRILTEALDSLDARG